MPTSEELFNMIRNYLMSKGINVNLLAEGDIYRLADTLIADSANAGFFAMLRTGEIR